MRIALATEADKLVIAPEQGREAQPRGWRMIAGAVRDEAGMPVDSAEMEILPIWHWNLSRYDGVRFEAYWVRFEAYWRPQGSATPIDEYHFVARHRKRNLAAVVEINKDTDTLDVILQPGVILTGKIVDSAGNGIEKAPITIKLKGSNWLEVHPGFFARTDAEGRFDIRALPLDHAYILTARIRGYGMTHVEVNSDDVRDNRIDAGPIVLARGKFTVSGVVVDANGKPVANAGVFCTGKDQVGMNSRTDADGKFTVDGIFKGPVKINASIQGDSARDLSYGSFLTRAGATNVKVVLRYSHTYGRH